MTLLILAQPGAIIDIYRERLIVAVICLNYSGDQETGARHHTCHRGSCYTQTASQMDYTPRPLLLYSKVGKQHGTLWLADPAAAHSLPCLARQPPIWLGIWLHTNCGTWWPTIKQTIHVSIRAVRFWFRHDFTLHQLLFDILYVLNSKFFFSKMLYTCQHCLQYYLLIVHVTFKFLLGHSGLLKLAYGAFRANWGTGLDWNFSPAAYYLLFHFSAKVRILQVRAILSWLILPTQSMIGCVLTLSNVQYVIKKEMLFHSSWTMLTRLIVN